MEKWTTPTTIARMCLYVTTAATDPDLKDIRWYDIQWQNIPPRLIVYHITISVFKVESCSRFMSLSSRLKCREAPEEEVQERSAVTDDEVPESRVNFHNTFSMLINMGNIEKGCRRTVSITVSSFHFSFCIWICFVYFYMYWLGLFCLGFIYVDICLMSHWDLKFYTFLLLY